MKNIFELAEKIGVQVEPYGSYCGKVEPISEPKGKLILVTAMTPTPFGEGKTTTSIGLADALNKIGCKTILALREPSLGPCFGIKGGAVGGGKSILVPSHKINLHFTGDFHALTSANNLIAALIDNHLYQGNALRINSELIQWNRCLDTNDRALRKIILGIDYFTRQASFDITVASELMAVFCLANDFDDLRHRIDNIILAYDYNNQPVTPKHLHATGSALALLLDAFKPNLVQTLYETPAFVHGGPFANIAHGCNSIQATKTALSLADFVVTEAGFASDLGAEKFINIKCRLAGLTPSVAVLVVTSKAINLHGLDNVKKHIDNLKSFNLPVVVALNKFPTDSANFIHELKDFCQSCGANFATSDVFAEGATGGVELANAVLDSISDVTLNFTYDLSDSIESKIFKVANIIYGAKDVKFSAKAKRQLAQLNAFNFPICIAKTPLSLSDNPKLKGCPTDFTVTVRGLKLCAGAGFVVVYLGDIMTMPGLPKVPAAENIDVVNGEIVGLK